MNTRLSMEHYTMFVAGLFWHCGYWVYHVNSGVFFFIIYLFAQINHSAQTTAGQFHILHLPSSYQHCEYVTASHFDFLSNAASETDSGTEI